METLRSTIVEACFRPGAEKPRSLLDFIDEQDVETMRDKLKDSIRESNVGTLYISIYSPNSP
jgi:autophagy-related protein 17